MENAKNTESYTVTKSLYGLIDILGFSDRFSKEINSCLELISSFVGHNDKHLVTQHKMRPGSFCLFDSVGLYIPIEFNSESHANEFYNPLLTFLHAISFLAYTALSKGYLMRGAITYGELYHIGVLPIGEPSIEAANQEKDTCYPRIILGNSALKEIEKFRQNCGYGWTGDKVSNEFSLVKVDANKTYFDWLNFYYKHSTYHVEPGKQLEIINTAKKAQKKFTADVLKQKDEKILTKLHWMIDYLKNFIAVTEESSITEF